MFSTHGKMFSADDLLKYFSYFSQKTGFDISCKLSLIETICMKYQILFYGENKKNIINLSSAELAQRVIKVNEVCNKSNCMSDVIHQSFSSLVSNGPGIAGTDINISIASVQLRFDYICRMNENAF